VNHLLFLVEEAVEQVNNNAGAIVTYTTLKERYEHLLNRCNHLLGGFIRGGGAGDESY